ncbi:hypothetical protein HK101_003772 [Irineochytrium annulatum]|nr:hypothetical protein HK101_003772 [Irineochytrium annulatum]
MPTTDSKKNPFTRIFKAQRHHSQDRRKYEETGTVADVKPAASLTKVASSSSIAGSDITAVAAIDLGQYRSLGSPGYNAFRTPQLNMGTAFSEDARKVLHLKGLIPSAVEPLEHQVKRSIEMLRELETPLSKFMYLDRLRAENSVLFYRLIEQDLHEAIAIIYTPTVGLACQRFSHMYTAGNAQGLFISLADKDNLDAVLSSWTHSGHPEPQICVMTDGSRILGLGDLGVNGMGIPIGKLSLYIAAGGFDPSRTLPVTLDLGTNTDKHLEDPYYIGVRTRRPEDPVFFEFVDEVMKAFKRKWPKMLVQFEDFSSEHAFQTMDRYRPDYLMFNDDIQGTGAVILGGFINAVRESGVKLEDHRILFLGAGSAGVGVAEQLAVYFQKSVDGMTKEKAKEHFYLMDSKGLLTADRQDASKYPDYKKVFMRHDMNGKQISSIIEAVKTIKPTALIGLSSQGGIFDQEILKAMADNNKRPIVFPLSNPSQNAECTFKDALKGTDGRVLFASGTAFPEETVNGKVVVPGQGNNMYIFPGLGLGGYLAGAKKITDDMVYQSAVTLAESLNEEEKADGLLYPVLDRIKEVSAMVATDVILAGVREGVATDAEVLTICKAKEGQSQDVKDTAARDSLLTWVKGKMWEARYEELNEAIARL